MVVLLPGEVNREEERWMERLFFFLVPAFHHPPFSSFQVLARPDLLRSAVTDLVLLHGLGVRLVVALGTKPQVDARLAARGAASRFVGGYRVTDADALAAAVDAAGAVRTVVEAAMSKVKREERGRERE